VKKLIKLPSGSRYRPVACGDPAEIVEVVASEHGEWPAGPAGVVSPNLQLSLYGPSGKDIMLVAVRGRADVYPLNLGSIGVVGSSNRARRWHRGSEALLPPENR
jgi:hypothetical protein